jgi:SAM-dependent methyltransferase
MKPFSDACERNREPILSVIKEWFFAPGAVLEIGAGTGQHAVYFAERLPHLTWISTDRAENHAGIKAWFAEAALSNLRGPLELDVEMPTWPVDSVDYVFSANTSHIMSWPQVEKMFVGISRVLCPQGVFCLYGPFNRNGEFTSESNRRFDASLKARDPLMGLRDDQALFALGKKNGLTHVADHAMPANNRVLVWRRDA